ncbi:MAG: hypothetical protein AAF481_00965 [Acidobacteriota bacterium]
MAQPALDDSFATRRRRALYLALQSMLPADAAAGGIRVWQEEFAERNPFGIADYGQRLAELFDIEDQRPALIARINECLRLDPSQLGPDPLAQLPKASFDFGTGPTAPVAAPADAPAMSAEFVVLNHLLDGLLDGFDRVRPGAGADLRKFVAAGPRGLRMSAVAREVVNAWCGNPKGMKIRSAVTVSEMSQLINAIYVWACEAFGPSAADRLIGGAVRRTSEIPEAATFPPRSLL